jgi:hypothetical protein
MPAFIHNRAEHILARNPSMNKSMAFAIATQQSHAIGKSPKGYGTSEGKSEAKKKYDSPKSEYKQTANPGKLESPKMSKESAVMLTAFGAELEEIMKEAGFKSLLMQEIPGTKPWLIGNSKLISGAAKPAVAGAGKAVAKAGLRTGQTATGAWDVSRQASSMGL